MNIIKQSSDKWIVTSTTPEYFEGVVALYNSVKLNMPEAKFGVFSYAKEDTTLVPTLRNTCQEAYIIEEAPMLGPIVEEGRARNGLPLGPDMFSRLLIPKYFSGRAFYVDADCLILKPIDELWDINLNGMPSGCVFRPDIGWIGGHHYDDMASGTILFDCDKWEELALVEKIYTIMGEYIAGRVNRPFKVNVESALSYAHEGGFLHLPPEYQNLTYYGELTQSDKVAHFAGPKPWFTRQVNRNPLNYVDLWEAYYNMDTYSIGNIQSNLPIERNKAPWNKRKEVQ